jgi:hypothetical protein
MLSTPSAAGDSLCVFTHDLALRQFAGSVPVTAWVTPAIKVWQFALHVLRKPAVVDPGSSAELLIDEMRIRRLAA